MISQNTITQVFETSRLEEVIGDFVQLKKSGSNFKGLSPFTDERSPSFMVSPVKQIWKDFSSGKGGNVVAFLMEHEHFSYPEAIKYLAKKYNIEVEETQQSDEQKVQASERESMYLVSEYAQKYFADILHTNEGGKAIGYSYFKERGFTPETIKEFNLGYALDEWEAFTKAALKEGYQLEFLEKTGLTIVKETKRFDRFKGRVLFPIHSMSGRVLGFGGRILSAVNKKAAKYLNSPESEIYHKSKVLYGIYHAKQAIAKEDNCYLVEGYTDVIQMHQAGIENVVASSGTALTSDQIRLIHRLTKNITVLFDGDAAGMRASLRGVDLILEQGMNVRVCTFPEGEDPDSFAKQNTLEDITTYLQENSKDFIAFKASVLNTESENEPVKKAETIRDIITSISKIPDVIKRELYIKECARIMDVSEAVLFSTLAQLTNAANRDAQKKNKPQQSFEVVKNAEPLKKVDEQYELERKIIQILLLYGTHVDAFDEYYFKENEKGNLELEKKVEEATVYQKIFLSLQDDEVEFTNQLFKELYYKIVERLQQTEEDLKIDQFINELDVELATEVTSVLMEEERYVLHDWERQNIFVKQKEESIATLVNSTILSLRRFLVSKKIIELSKNVSQEESNQNLLQDVVDYMNLKKVLSEKLNRVL